MSTTSQLTNLPKSILTKASRALIPGAVALLLLAWPTHRGQAQVIPALRAPANFSGFANVTVVKPDYQFYGDYALQGATIGTFIQTRYVLGAELRGSINRLGGLEHEESVLAGPRFARHFHLLSPSVSVLGGGANAWRFSNPPLKGLPKPRVEEGFGPAWSVVGGVDLHLRRHLAVRMAEFSYSKIYLKEWTMTPLSVSSGLIYRFR